MMDSDKVSTRGHPKWEPDDASLDCFTCLAKFNFSRRRHHCRCCGHVICGTCSHARVVLPKLGYLTDVRVCVNCHAIIMAKRRRLDISKVVTFISIFSVSNRKYAKETAKLEEQMAQIYEKIRIQRQMISEVVAKNEDHRKQEEDMNNLFQVDSTLRTEVMKLRIAQGLLVKVALLPKQLVAEKKKFKKNAATEKEWEAFDLKMQNLPHRFLIITGEPHTRIALTEVLNRPDELKHKSKTSLRSLKLKDLHGGGANNFRRRIQHLKTASSEDFFQQDRSQKEKMNVMQFHWIRTINQVRRVAPWDSKSANGDAFIGVVLAWDEPSCWIEEKDKDFNKKNSTNEKQPTIRTVPRDATLRLINPGIDKGDRGDFSLKQVKVIELLKAHKEKHNRRIKRQKPIIHALYETKKVTVDWDNPDHHGMLKQLWQGFHYPEELIQTADDGTSMEFPGRKHELWKTIGFQGKDPTTDFRGMGLLSVKALIYLGDQYPELARRLAKTDRPYPLCASVINVCHAVGEFLTITNAKGPTRPFSKVPLFNIFCLAQYTDYYQEQLHSYLSEKKEGQLGDLHVHKGRDIQDHYFEELVIAILVVLDRKFVKLNAGYLDFPKIMNDIKQRLGNILESEPVHFNAFVTLFLTEDEEISDSPDIPDPIIPAQTPARRTHKDNVRFARAKETNNSVDFMTIPGAHTMIFSDDDDDEAFFYTPEDGALEEEPRLIGTGLPVNTRKRSSWKAHEEPNEIDEREPIRNQQRETEQNQDQQAVDNGKEQGQSMEKNSINTLENGNEMQEQHRGDGKIEYQESGKVSEKKDRETNIEGVKGMTKKDNRFGKWSET